MNQRIKEYAKEKGVKLWQVADELKIADGQLSRKLRYECFAVTKLTEELLDEYVESVEVHPGNEVRISWK